MSSEGRLSVNPKKAATHAGDSSEFGVIAIRDLGVITKKDALRVFVASLLHDRIHVQSAPVMPLRDLRRIRAVRCSGQLKREVRSG